MELQLQHLRKQYGTKSAVDNVSIHLEPGVYGLLGANGAGKTTLMRMICGVLKPTSGSIRLDGKTMQELGERYYTHLGDMPQDFGFYPNFTEDQASHSENSGYAPVWSAGVHASCDCCIRTASCCIWNRWLESSFANQRYYRPLSAYIPGGYAYQFGRNLFRSDCHDGLDPFPVSQNEKPLLCTNRCYSGALHSHVPLSEWHYRNL